MKRFIYCADLHGDKHDPSAVSVLKEFTRDFKPHYRICGGDLFDFAPLRKSASPFETSISLIEDLEFGKEFLKEWKPQWFLRGNHDERLWDCAATEFRDGLRRDAATNEVAEIEDICRKKKITILPYNKRQGLLKINDLGFIHGFNHGANAIKTSILSFGTSIIMGHCHTPQAITIPGVVPKHGYMTGCLCQLDYDYNRSSLGTLSWQHGFVYGFVGPKGYHVYLATRTPSGWFLPTEWGRYKATTKGY